MSLNGVYLSDKRYEHKLRDLSVRPMVGGRGRKVTGTLTTHKNGFRYESNRGQHIDIIYANIKHAFFQPAQNTPNVVLHFELKDPILIGKKRSNVGCYE